MHGYHQKWALNTFLQSGQHEAHILRAPPRCCFSGHTMAGFISARDFAGYNPERRFFISSNTLANFIVRVGKLLTVTLGKSYFSVQNVILPYTHMHIHNHGAVHYSTETGHHVDHCLSPFYYDTKH